MKKKLYVLILTFLIAGCSSNLQEFLTQKELTEIKYGPCNWEFVGTDTKIENPALILDLPIFKDFVIWNQKCNKLDGNKN